MMNYCRWSQSLGELDSDAFTAWSTPPYVYPRDRNKQVVFFGLYDFRDFYALWRHHGKAWILWAGSDLLNLSNGFLFNDGKLKTLSKLTKGWFHREIVKVIGKADNWVENETEAQVLRNLGVKVAGICPSYMGKINLPVTFTPGKAIYISAGQGRAVEYGFHIVERIAPYLPWMDFHLFGDEWITESPNVHCYGRVPKSVFAEETSKMQIALSLNEFCGFSEVIARGILQGHYAVSKVSHPHVPSFDSDLELVGLLNRLGKEQEPNKAREYYRNVLNTFPWVSSISRCEWAKTD